MHPKIPYICGARNTVTKAKRASDCIAPVRPDMPCAVILVHGVNDVGTSYKAMEDGICAGLGKRLNSEFEPASYRIPTTADRARVEADPDDVFFKRKISATTRSPVIPFYWGFREVSEQAVPAEKTKHGQNTDRYGNRLDADFSRGGGPFANATTSLPDLWNRGKSGMRGALDKAQRDPTHPVRNNPGRMYMVLAARRLAALIATIRDYEPADTVSIVAHSQGCLVSLLAQAFLLDPDLKSSDPNARPADALILCNPPYSLMDDMPWIADAADHFSGEDAAMRGLYGPLEAEQTLHARLTTLVNIVHGVARSKRTSPALADLKDNSKFNGVVGAKWEASKDRDNRGKVYLYFSPEDMTVALVNVQGIGWQGVPDFQRGRQAQIVPVRWWGRDDAPTTPRTELILTSILRHPLRELGPSFLQRVFTAKRRPHPVRGDEVRVGQQAHD
ncbi:MAG TPA: hypothetical protein VIT92_15600, partial [Burkholderiaceae bacterium]